MRNAPAKAIIICAGEASRWGNYLNTPKHLITIEGERLLDRTVRLLRERGIEEIYTVVRSMTREYRVPGAAQYVAALDPEAHGDADKFLSSRDLWNKHGRTLVFYGDCYFTEEAMDTIIGFASREWTLFCRPQASEITGTPWGECFAHSFYPEDLERHENRLHYIIRLFKQGAINRLGGWEHYRAMTGRSGEDVGKHVMTTHYVTIDDWTDDFDYPKDLESWLENRKSLTP